MNKLLSISIPSFERAEILSSNLSYMLEEIVEHSIGIYISDDSDGEGVKIMSDEFSLKYENIFYSRNQPRLGHDKNFINSLNLPSSDYVWLLGDSMRINHGAIGDILEVIQNSKPGIISVNHQDRITSTSKPYQSQHYTEAETVFDLFAWHLTLTGTTVYSYDAINFLNQHTS